MWKMKEMHKSGTLILIVIYWSFKLTSTELVVNVKNQGGEVFQESIHANVTDETIRLQLHQPDGTIITQFIDFRNEIQIINVVLLGEEEQREPQFQVLCFVTHFKKTDFIPPDAMAKLRQKNPWTIRVPEKDVGKENVTLDVLLDITSSDWVSPHIKTNCLDAKDGTYAKRDELESLVAAKVATGNVNVNVNGLNELEGTSVEAHEQFLRAVKPFPLVEQDCSLKKDLNKPCLCELELCIGWYPCALKYCRGRDSGGKSASYRCGIHTCKMCRRYVYSVSRKFSCMWLSY